MTRPIATALGTDRRFLKVTNSEENMKKVLTMLVLCATLCLAGCTYDVPLAEKQDLPVDIRAIGVWQDTGEDAEKRFTIARYSETEYAFDFPKDFLEEKRTFLRGYPIKVGGVALVQLVMTDKNYRAQVKKGAYCLITFEFSDDDLIIRMVDLKEEGQQSKSSAELRAVFLSKKDDKSIYGEGVRYRRVVGN